MADWRKRGVLGEALRAHQRSRAMRFEALEPRLLLSADLTYAAGAGAIDATLRVDESGAVPILQLVDNDLGTILQSQEINQDINFSVLGGEQNDKLAIGFDGASVPLPYQVHIDFDGGAGNDTLVGPSADSTWIIDGPNSGKVGSVSFSGVENLTGAAGNEDTFVFEDGGSLSGVVEGGAGGFDSLAIAGGAYDSVVYTATGPDSGSIHLDGEVIAFAGMEPITDNTSATDRVITFTSGAQTPDNVRVSSTPAGMIKVETLTGTAESVTFAHPTNSLTINLGVGDDTITIELLDPVFTGAGGFTINGGDGTDTIVIPTRNADFTLTDTQLSVGTEAYALSGIENANLTGGAGANSFTVSGWTGTAQLSGLAGNDIYAFGPGRFGAVTIAGATDSGTDTLDFTALGATPGLTVTNAGASISKGLDTITQTGGNAEEIDALLNVGTLGGALDDLVDFVRQLKEAQGDLQALRNQLPLLDRAQAAGLADVVALTTAFEKFVTDAKTAISGKTKLSEVVGALNALTFPSLPAPLTELTLTVATSYRGKDVDVVGGVDNRLELLLDFSLEAKASKQFDIDLGEAAENIGVAIDGTVTANGKLNADFSIGLSTAATPTAFLVPGAKFDLEVAATATLPLNTPINLSFLELTGSGSLKLGGRLGLSVIDSDGLDDGRINLAAFAPGRIVAGTPVGTLGSAGAFFESTVQVKVKAGLEVDGVDLSTLGADKVTFNLSLADGADPFGDNITGVIQPKVSVSAATDTDPNLDLLDFSNISPSEILGMLQQVSDFLGGIAGSEFLTTPIPFTELTLGDVLDFGLGFKQSVIDPLFKSGDSLKPDNNGDGAVDAKDLNFSSIQQLGERLTGISLGGGGAPSNFKLTPQYISGADVSVRGKTVSDTQVQLVTVQNAKDGTFKLRNDATGVTTGAIAFNAPAEGGAQSVKELLNAALGLETVTSVTMTSKGLDSRVYEITFASDPGVLLLEIVKGLDDPLVSAGNKELTLRVEFTPSFGFGEARVGTSQEGGGGINEKQTVTVNAVASPAGDGLDDTFQLGLRLDAGSPLLFTSDIVWNESAAQVEAGLERLGVTLTDLSDVTGKQKLTLRNTGGGDFTLRQGASNVTTAIGFDVDVVGLNSVLITAGIDATATANPDGDGFLLTPESGAAALTLGTVRGQRAGGAGSESAVDVSVTKDGKTYTVTFNNGALAGTNVPQMVSDSRELLGALSLDFGASLGDLATLKTEGAFSAFASLTTGITFGLDLSPSQQLTIAPVVFAPGPAIEVRTSIAGDGKVAEVQTVTIRNANAGTFALTLPGGSGKSTTDSVDITATANTLRDELRKLPALSNLADDSVSRVANAATGTIVYTITFHKDSGDVPELKPITSLLKGAADNGKLAGTDPAIFTIKLFNRDFDLAAGGVVRTIAEQSLGTFTVSVPRDLTNKSLSDLADDVRAAINAKLAAFGLGFLTSSNALSTGALKTADATVAAAEQPLAELRNDVEFTLRFEQLVAQGTPTSGTTTTLTKAGEVFTSKVKVGDRVINTSTGATGTVTSVADTAITHTALSNNIAWVSTDSYEIRRASEAAGRLRAVDVLDGPVTATTFPGSSDTQQLVTLGNAGGGTFTLTAGGLPTTAAIEFDAPLMIVNETADTAGQSIEALLEARLGSGSVSSVTVDNDTSDNSRVYTIVFASAQSLSVDGANLEADGRLLNEDGTLRSAEAGRTDLVASDYQAALQAAIDAALGRLKTVAQANAAGGTQFGDFKATVGSNDAGKLTFEVNNLQVGGSSTGHTLELSFRSPAQVDAGGGKVTLSTPPARYSAVALEAATRLERSVEISTEFDNAAYQQIGVLTAPTRFDGSTDDKIDLTLHATSAGGADEKIRVVVNAGTRASIDELIAALQAQVDLNNGAFNDGDILVQRADTEKQGNRIAFVGAEGKVKTISMFVPEMIDTGTNNETNGAITELGYAAGQGDTKRGKSTQFFVEDATFLGDFALIANDVAATATFGFLGIRAEGGGTLGDDKFLAGSISLGLRNPDDGGTRLTPGDIVDALGDGRVFFDADDIVAMQQTGVLDGGIAAQIGFKLDIAPDGFLSGLKDDLNASLEIGVGSPNWLVARPSLSDPLGFGDAKDNGGAEVVGPIVFTGAADQFTLGATAPVSGELDTTLSFVISNDGGTTEAVGVLKQEDTQAGASASTTQEAESGAPGKNEIQEIRVANASGGTFKITFDGKTSTLALGHLATDVEMASALQQVGFATANFTVIVVENEPGSGDRVFTIEFKVGLAGTNVGSLGIAEDELTRTRADLEDDLQAAIKAALIDLGGTALQSKITATIDASGKIELAGESGFSIRGNTIEVDFTGPDFDGLLSRFKDLSFRDIIAGLQKAVEFLQSVDGSDGNPAKVPELNTNLPLVNRSVSDLLDPAKDFLAFVDGVAANPAGSVQQLNVILADALGFAAPETSVDVTTAAAVQTVSLDNVSAGTFTLQLGDALTDDIQVISDSSGAIDTGALETTVAAELGAITGGLVTVVVGETPSSDVLSSDLTLTITFGSAQAPLVVDGRRLIALDILSLNLEGPNPVLDIDLGFGVGVKLARPFDLDLADAISQLGLPSFLTNLVGVDASGTLSVDAGVDLNLAFGVDLAGEQKAMFIRTADTGITARAQAIGSGLEFGAKLGPFGLFVVDGEARLNGLIDIGLFDADGDGRLVLVGTGNDLGHLGDFFSSAGITVALTGGAELPLFIGTEDNKLPLDFGSATPGTENALIVLLDALEIFDGTADGDNGIDITFPQVSVDFLTELPIPSLFALLSDPAVVIDGLDRLLFTLQDALNGQIMGVELPFVGDLLADNPAANIIGDFRDDLLKPLANTIRENNLNLDGLIGLMKNTFFDVLGPNGPFAGFGGLLRDSADAGTDVTADDIVVRFLNASGVAVTPDSLYSNVQALQFDFDLGKSVHFDAPEIEFDLGVPAIGIEVDLAPQISIDFNLHIGFGIDQNDGFYFVTGFDKEADAPDGTDGKGDPDKELNLDIVVDFGSTQLDRKSATGRLVVLALMVHDGVDTDGDGELEFSRLFLNAGVDLVDPGGDGRLSFSEMTSGSLSEIFVVSAEGGAQLRLAAEVDFSTLDASLANVLPSISTDILVDFLIEAAPGSGITVHAPEVAFLDVTLDLGSFISDFAGPILEAVGDVLGPLDWLIGPDGFLNKRIPLLSDLLGKTVTGKDLIVLYDPKNGPKVVAFLDFVEQLYFLTELVTDAAAQAKDGSIVINFGDVVLADNVGSGLNLTEGGGIVDQRFLIELPSVSDLRDLKDLKDTKVPSAPKTPDLPKATGSKTSEFTKGVTKPGSVNFPILKPENVFKLLMGQTVSLVEIQMPELGFEFFYRQTIPIWGPIVGFFSGKIGGTLNLGFGYDTLGLEQFLVTDNPANLINGFFLNDLDPVTGFDRPEAELNLEIAIGAGLSLGFITAGVEGGFAADVDFNLADLNDDGKVRFDELAGNIVANSFNPLAIFDISGEFQVFLRAFYEINLGLFSISDSYEFVRETVFAFDIPFERPSILAVQNGDVLTLNVGSNSAGRLQGDIRDISESVTVETKSDGSVVVWSNQFNVNRTVASINPFVGVKKIVADGGAGNDFIDLSGVVHGNIEVEVRGGAGNDTILGSHRRDVLFGDGGNDRLEGRGGGDELHGGDGNDFLLGGGDADSLFGEKGNDRLDGGDGVDRVDGGLGDDTFLRSTGVDVIALASFGSTDVIDGSGEIKLDFSDKTENLTYFLKDDAILVGFGEQFIDTASILLESNIDTTKNYFANQAFVTSPTGVSHITGSDFVDTFHVQQTASAIVLDGAKGNDAYLFYAGAGALRATVEDQGNPWNSGDRIDVIGTTGADEITVTSNRIELDAGGSRFVNYVAPPLDANVLQIRVRGDNHDPDLAGNASVGGDDTIRIKSTAAAVAVRVDAGLGDDQVIVGDGTVDAIAGIQRPGLNTPFGLGPVVLIGGGGHDVVIIDDSADSSDNVGNLTAVTEKRLGSDDLVEVGIVSGLDMSLALTPKITVTTETQGGSGVNEVQIVRVENAAGGTFKLSFNGQQTGAIASGAAASDVEAALQALSTPPDVAVTRTDGGNAVDYRIEFLDPSNQDVGALVADASGLARRQMDGRVEFEGFEVVDVRLGTGSDTFTVGGGFNLAKTSPTGGLADADTGVDTEFPKGRLAEDLADPDALGLRQVIHTISGITLVSGGDEVVTQARNEVQELELVTPGSFTLTFVNPVSGVSLTTDALNFDAEVIEQALLDLANIAPGEVSVEEAGDKIRVLFLGALGEREIAPLVATPTSTGGGTVTVTSIDGAAAVGGGDTISVIATNLLNRAALNTSLNRLEVASPGDGTVQTLTVKGSVHAEEVGYFTLQYRFEETRPIAVGASAEVVQDALAALSTIGNDSLGNPNVQVTAVPLAGGTQFTITFRFAPAAGETIDKLVAQVTPLLISGGSGIDQLNVEAVNQDLFFLGGDDADFVDLNVDTVTLAPLSGNGVNANVSLDGQDGSDNYEINLVGGTTASLVNVFDTGAAGSGFDELVVLGTDDADNGDLFLLRASAAQNGLAFVALLNDADAVERVNYNIRLEKITVEGRQGDDEFYMDDTRSAITINGGEGDDFFQIGQLYKTRRTPELATVAEEDVYATIETTRGWLSNGISFPMTINGQAGEDRFIVFRNQAQLTLSGGADDDSFIVKAFALVGSKDDDAARTDLSGDGGADFIEYSVNAPVTINGGDGFDTVVVIGTEFGDDFVVTDKGVFGAGLNVSFINIEFFEVDAAEGDDRFFIQGTGAGLVTQIVGGLGSDSFFVNGETPGNGVISNDLRGHSGIIEHFAVSSIAGSLYDGAKVVGISANVADNDEPALIVTQSNGFSSVVEGGGFDTYTVVLSRPPRPGKTVTVDVAPPRGIVLLREDLTEIRNPAGAATGFALQFSSSNWYEPQTVRFAVDGSLTDIPDLGDIEHRVTADDTITGTVAGSSNVDPDPAVEGDEFGLLVDSNSPFPTSLTPGFPEGLRGRLVTITDSESNPEAVGQSRLILSNTADTLTVNNPWSVLPPSDAKYEILQFSGTSIPNVRVEIFSAAVPALVVEQVDGANTGTGGATAVAEGAGDAGADVVRLRLSQAPAMGQMVTVNLASTQFGGVEPATLGQLRFFDESGAPITQISFDASNYATFRTITVTAYNDEIVEGFHKADMVLTAVGGAYNGVSRTVVVDVADDDAPGVRIIESDGSTDVIEFDPALISAISVVGGAQTQTGKVYFNSSPDNTLTYTFNVTGAPLSGAVLSVSAFADLDHFTEFLSLEAEGTSLGDLFRFSIPGNSLSVSAATTVQINQDLLEDLAEDDKIVFTVKPSSGVNNFSFFRGPSRLTLNLTFPGEADPEAAEAAAVAAGFPKVDTYQVVLTQAPTTDEVVTVTVDPRDTRTTRTGGIVTFAEQVEVSTDGVNFFTTVDLKFTHADWDKPRTVYVRAIDDPKVDGADTQVFATTLDQVNSIQGPLFIIGGEGTDRTGLLEREPIMLPGEINQRPSLGDVLAATEAVDGGAQATITVDATDPALLSALGVASADLITAELWIDKTIEITEGPGKNKARIITVAVEGAEGEWTLSVHRKWFSAFSGDASVPTATSRFAIFETNPNFLVDEADQVDFLTIDDTDNINSFDDPALDPLTNPFAVGRMFFDDSTAYGTSDDPLNRHRITGFGMGGDRVIGSGSTSAALQPGGITYDGVEVTQLNLGDGNNLLEIDNTQKRADGFQTWTIVNTGGGDDTVKVNLEEGVDGSVSINLQGGDDTFEGGVSTLPLIVFGDDGDDHVTGGTGDDIIFGDRGRIDYLNEGGEIVTRLGFIPEQIQGFVTTPSADARLIDNGQSFPTEGRGLAGLIVIITDGAGLDERRLITGNTEHELTLDAPWSTPLDATSKYLILTEPEFQTDGTVRGANFVETLDPSLGGVDTIVTGEGRDIVFGGRDGDFLDAEGIGIAADIIIGDHGRARFSQDGILERIETTDPDAGGADTIRGGPGSNIILGGAGGDEIRAGGDDSPDIILGDNGYVVFVDGVRREVKTSDPDSGGADTIVAGDGPNVLVGGSDADTITGGAAEDIILGDNGRALFSPAGVLIFIETLVSDEPNDSGADTIRGSNGADVIFGGSEGDTILAGGSDAARDIVLGDNGFAVFTEAGVLVRIETRAEERDGDDRITVGNGPDVVLGGNGNDIILAATAGDEDDLDAVLALIDAGNFAAINPGDNAADVILGDNGIANFTGNAVLLDIRTSDPEQGGKDIIVGGNGPDVIFGGSYSDVIVAGGDDNAEDIVLGDNGRATFQGTELFAAGEASSILSFNFNGRNQDTIVSGVAGAVPAGNWNNLRDDGPTTFGDEAGELLYFDDGAIAPGVTIEWGADLDSTHPGDPDDLHEETHSQISILSDSSQDLRLFEGYLSSNTNDTVGVNIAGLGRHFRIYDVYVYLDLDDGDSRSGSSVRSITDGTTKFYLDDPDGNTFSGTYVQVSATDATGAQRGNYVVFTGLSSDAVSLRIDDVGGSSSNKPGITAVQVVGTHHPIDRIETLPSEYGGVDVITTGGGADIVFGGEKGDFIFTGGNAIFGEVDADIVAGDNARATFTVRGAAGDPGSTVLAPFDFNDLREVVTTDFELAGTLPGEDGDLIVTGNGNDLVIGGNGGDFIYNGVPAGSYDYGEISVVSINFNSDVAKGSITGVAGAVAVDGWHNVTGGKGTAALGGIQVQWGEEKSSKQGTTLGNSADTDSHEGIYPDTQNERLFEGYLEEDDRTLGVDLSGLGDLGIYDVYVYLDSDQADHDRDDPAVVKVSAGETSYYVDDAMGNTFDGAFVDASSTNPLTPATGNFVVFRGLSATNLSIRLSGDESLGRHADGRPSIAAIQIVSGADRAKVVLTGDVDEDRVVGDNAVVRWFAGQVYEIVTTDLQASGPFSPYRGDTITTGSGADIVIGGNGGDDIAGGEGHDLLLGDNARLILFGGRVIGLGAGNPGDFDDDGDDHDHHFDPYGVQGIELLGSTIGGNDVLEGGKDDDLIYGQFGDDTYVFAGGGLGQDYLVEAGGDHHHHHDDHDHDGHHHDHGPNDLHDRLDFSLFIGGIDIDLDEAHQQTINGDRHEGDVNLKLVLFHGDAFEDVTGSEFADDIEGNDRGNILIGRGGDDEIAGEGGDDVLLGMGGNDVLEGGSGNDLLDGGAGNDVLRGGKHDHDDDDDGKQSPSYGSDILLGGAGDDWLYGDKGNDLLDGEEGNDRLEGGSGDDILIGGAGNDYLKGDSGADKLEGGLGLDTLKSDKQDTLVVQETAERGKLGLQQFFTAFGAQFDQRGFAFRDPSAGNPLIDDRPARLWIDWNGSGFGNLGVQLSPYEAPKPAKGAMPSFAEFVKILKNGETREARFDSLGRTLLGDKR